MHDQCKMTDMSMIRTVRVLLNVLSRNSQPGARYSGEVYPSCPLALLWPRPAKTCVVLPATCPKTDRTTRHLSQLGEVLLPSDFFCVHAGVSKHNAGVCVTWRARRWDSWPTYLQDRVSSRKWVPVLAVIRAGNTVCPVHLSLPDPFYLESDLTNSERHLHIQYSCTYISPIYISDGFGE